jgi:hypothetical protein
MLLVRHFAVQRKTGALDSRLASVTESPIPRIDNRPQIGFHPPVTASQKTSSPAPPVSSAATL